MTPVVRNSDADKRFSSAGESFTAPFDFGALLKKRRDDLDFVPIIDLLVIGLFVSMLFTRFVVLPGVRVDLPTTEMRLQHSGVSVAVLTIGLNRMLFFNNNVYDETSIKRAFDEYLDRGSKRAPELLIKAESSMDLQAFLVLCELAQEAGFERVQIVGQKRGAGVDSALPALLEEFSI